MAEYASAGCCGRSFKEQFEARRLTVNYVGGTSWDFLAYAHVVRARDEIS